MYICLVDHVYNAAIVLHNCESLANLFSTHYPRYTVIAFGRYDDCQICANAYNAD